MQKSSPQPILRGGMLGQSREVLGLNTRLFGQSVDEGPKSVVCPFLPYSVIITSSILLSLGLRFCLSSPLDHMLLGVKLVSDSYCRI